MARKEYLSSDERSRFDSPPQLENIRILIEIPIWAENYLKTLFTSTNKVGDRRSASFCKWDILESQLVFLIPTYFTNMTSIWWLRNSNLTPMILV